MPTPPESQNQSSQETHQLLQQLLQGVETGFTQLHQADETQRQRHQQRAVLMRERIKKQDRKHRLIMLSLIPVGLAVILLGAQMFKIIYIFADAMTSMQHDMSKMSGLMTNMSNNMQSMSGDMHAMNTHMLQMQQDMGGMRVHISHMDSMAVNMASMSENMGTMSERVAQMQAATASMEYGLRHMTHDMNTMSNTVAPTMHGMRQMMPWAYP